MLNSLTYHDRFDVSCPRCFLISFLYLLYHDVLKILTRQTPGVFKNVCKHTYTCFTVAAGYVPVTGTHQATLSASIEDERLYLKVNTQTHFYRL